jgi:predicted RNase H-like HicB family nuclease
MFSDHFTGTRNPAVGGWSGRVVTERKHRSKPMVVTVSGHWTGPTLQQTKHDNREAIELHLEAMLEAGDPISVPNSDVDFVELKTVA